MHFITNAKQYSKFWFCSIFSIYISSTHVGMAE